MQKEMGTESAPRIGSCDSEWSEARLYSEFDSYISEVRKERNRIQNEIKWRGEELSRLKKMKQSLLEQNRYREEIDDLEIQAYLYEGLNEDIRQFKAKISSLYAELTDYNILFDTIQFAHSDWCQFLLLGNRLTPRDILKEWHKEALKQWEEVRHQRQHRGTKFSEDTIQQILELYDQGYKKKEIARQLDISSEPVFRYIKERRSNEH